MESDQPLKESDQPDGRKVRKRIGREERERQIVDEAIRFFSEVGFSGEMRELARRLGVNQSLIYRFFENKEALIERVYMEVFINSWNPFWEESLKNRSVPLLDRLINHYVNYSRNVLTYEWVRIFLFAGLRGEDLNKRFVEHIREHVLTPILGEFREELKLPSKEERSFSEMEFEILSGIHADIFYLGVKKFVYGIELPKNIDEVIKMKVTTLYHGVRASMQIYWNSRA